MQISKTSALVDRLKKNDKVAEKLIDKLHTVSQRKSMVMNDFNQILEGLEMYCTAEQTQKISAVRNLKNKVDAKSHDIKKAVSDFARREYNVSKMRKLANKKPSVASHATSANKGESQKNEKQE